MSKQSNTNAAPYPGGLLKSMSPSAISGGVGLGTSFNGDLQVASIFSIHPPTSEFESEISEVKSMLVVANEIFFTSIE
jgi:hypothetical protein